MAKEKSIERKKKNEQLLPISAYLKVWVFVMVLISLSYAIFLLQIEPLWLRRFLFTAIALTQAALGVSYFMNMRLERPGLVYAIVLPVTLLIALIVFALGEGSYVLGVRQASLTAASADKLKEHPEGKPSTPPEDLVERGKLLAQSKGCLRCHSLTGETFVGPTWQGLYGSQRELQDGTTVIADEAYLKESIVDPNAKIVKGFPPAMPAFGHLSDEELQALIVYIKSLAVPQESSEDQ